MSVVAKRTRASEELFIKERWHHHFISSHFIISTYGHILQLAEQVAEGVKKAGVDVDIFQVSETLSEEILEKMHAPPKVTISLPPPPVLVDYD
jgi:hypothetical protein